MEGKLLTAFLPWSRQELHVLHSMHCHRKAFTRTVSSGKTSDRMDDLTKGEKRQTEQSRIALQLYERNAVEKGNHLKSKHQGKQGAPGSLPPPHQDLTLQFSFMSATYTSPSQFDFLKTWKTPNLY